MDSEVVANFAYCINSLRLEYITTCKCLDLWPGGDPQEQEFLMQKKDRIYRCLLDYNLKNLDSN
jgi:hypothetical protein